MRLLKFSIIKRIKKSKGFTLIELLVVISIISLLSSIVMVAVKDAKEKANATAFRAGVEQFIKALEMYRNDHDGLYPGEETGTQNLVYTISSTTVPTELTTALIPKYISKIPTPSNYSLIYKVPNGTPLVVLTRCFEDSSVPKYLLYINKSEPGFEDWKYGTIAPTVKNTTLKCFSLQ